MCSKCAELLVCPVGEKRTVELFRIHNEKGDSGVVTMALDRYPYCKDAYIVTEVIVGNTHTNLPVDISYCPFCGTKLRDPLP